MTKTEKLTAYAKKVYGTAASVRYGRSESQCGDPSRGGAVPYGYTLYPGTGFAKDVEFIGESFKEAWDAIALVEERNEQQYPADYYAAMGEPE